MTDHQVSMKYEGMSDGFIKVPISVLYSKAWQALSGSARNVYLYLLSSEKKHQKGLSFTYSKARKLNMSNATVRKAFVQLQDKGFITMIVQGGIVPNRESVYDLSYEWKYWVQAYRADKHI